MPTLTRWSLIRVGDVQFDQRLTTAALHLGTLIVVKERTNTLTDAHRDTAVPSGRITPDR
jgi:hypothetical protein